MQRYISETVHLAPMSDANMKSYDAIR